MAQQCCGMGTPRVRRALNFMEWAAPGTILLLLPKCPMCLAAYIALATGIGISFPAAAYLRLTLLGLCTVSLLYLTVRSLRRQIPKWRGATAITVGTPRQSV